jgi:glycosyltransferase involved in cell wall biosynthesis
MRYASGAAFPLHFARYLRARRIEKKLLQKTPHRAFISRRDREAVLGPVKDDSKVIPNGVDLGYWTRKTYNPLPNRIVYSGAMDYPPNADGAFYLIQKILPHVRRLISNIEVVIVGRDPSPALIKLAAQYPNVKVTGLVDDIRPYLEQATVYVGPLRIASGIQNKLLEALAMEVPVVTTPVAADGLQVEGGDQPPVLVADGEKEFAESVVYLLTQTKDRSRLAAEGRHFVKNHFNWSHSAKMLEEMCLTAVSGLQ